MRPACASSTSCNSTASAGDGPAADGQFLQQPPALQFPPPAGGGQQVGDLDQNRAHARARLAHSSS